jgi:SAM-dependent methyltransferase
MNGHDVGILQNFWGARAANTETPEEAVTHPDVWQRWLEIESIKRFVRPSDRVLDVGCGNGYTTTHIALLVREIVGIDVSTEMIARARSAEGDGVAAPGAMTFTVCDVLELDHADVGLFDVAISERCLINLPGWPEQQRAIANIASVLKPGGRFILVEGSRGGRERLNRLRQAVGLDPMSPVWHNVDFDEEETLAYLGRWFIVEHRLHFGGYDFISRVVHPLVVAPEAPRYDARINQVAAKLACHLQEFGEISRILFLVLRKKDDSHDY